MNIMTRTENRPAMAKALAEKLEVDCTYEGPPSFAYKVGELTVNRDSSISSDNEELLRSIRPFLKEKDWLDEGFEQFMVSIPIMDLTGSQLTSIVNMVRSKQYLLNRVMRGELYAISPDFIQELKNSAPQSQGDFFALYDALPENSCKGLLFGEGRVSFMFNLDEDPDRVKAFTELAACIVAASKQAKRVSAIETISENEKFYLRAWLVRIGMGDADYKQSRRLLLEGLKGHTAFKTEEQKERHRMKHQANQVIPVTDLAEAD